MLFWQKLNYNHYNKLKLNKKKNIYDIYTVYVITKTGIQSDFGSIAKKLLRKMYSKKNCTRLVFFKLRVTTEPFLGPNKKVP